MKLSIIIPVYNEIKTIEKILKKIISINWQKDITIEIITIDDFSKDGSREWLIENKPIYNYKLVLHNKNKGKGDAIKSGIKESTGNIIVIQDADLEYDPNDLVKMLDLFLKDKTVKVVYGSRRLNKNNKQYSGYSYYMGGVLLTWLSNFLYNTRITDEPTCYKMFDSELIKSFNLECKKFEFCPEVTAKTARKKIKIHEIPISYSPRHSNEGKKIKLTDGISAIWTLIKYKIKN